MPSAPRLRDPCRYACQLVVLLFLGKHALRLIFFSRPRSPSCPIFHKFLILLKF